MLTRLDIITPPSAQVVSVDTVKLMARVDDDNFDTIVSSYIDTATDLAQNYLARTLLTTTFGWTISRTSIPHANYNWGFANFASWQWGAGWFDDFLYGRGGHHIELPRSPAQNILSVSRGHWGTSPDTFLTQNVDYQVDLASTPARLRMLWNTSTSSICNPADHITVVFTAGYDQTSTITISGSTATAAGTLTATVAGLAVSVPVAVGDTPAITAQALWAAITANVPNVSGSLLTPTLISLRGPNALATVTTKPSNLTVTPSVPVSSIPSAVINAITYLAASLYQQGAAPDTEAPAWFYAQLAPYRLVYFA